MPSLSPGDGQDLLETFKRGWEKRDPELILAMFDADAEYREHPFGPVLAGSNAIRELWNGIAASQTHVEFDAERVWVSGSTVLSSWHAAYTVLATGERRRVRGFITLEVNEGGRVQ